VGRPSRLKPPPQLRKVSPKPTVEPTYKAGWSKDGSNGTGGGRKKRTFFRSGAFDRPLRGSSHPSCYSGLSGIRTRMNHSTTTHQQFAESSARLEGPPHGFSSSLAETHSQLCSPYPPHAQDDHPLPLDLKDPQIPALPPTGRPIVLNWDFSHCF
ncbi:uncharacterized protein VP01_4645g1, partial [Puccinia sorghi]